MSRCAPASRSTTCWSACRTTRGDTSGISVTTRALRRPDSEQPYGVVATFTDVTERLQAERRLREAPGQAREANAALVDARAAALSGSRGHRHADGDREPPSLRGAVEEALREGPERVGVLVVDLDRFKRVNDTLGPRHRRRGAARGRAPGRRRLCTDDLLARWGGGKLAVLAAARPAAARRPAARRRGHPHRGRRPARGDGATARWPWAVWALGWRASSLHGDDASTLVDTADAALYAAKRGGRNLRWLAHELAPDELIGGDNDTLAIAEAVALVAANGSLDLAGRRAERVAELGARVAEELGLPAELVHRARLGGWLRDLAGPSAEDVVGRIPALAPAARAVRHREERWDGTGVPDGVAGELIPVEARIVACASAYVRAATRETGRTGRLLGQRAVRRDAGTLFDPAVVLALRHVLARERGARHRRARRAARGDRRGA